MSCDLVIEEETIAPKPNENQMESASFDIMNSKSRINNPESPVSVSSNYSLTSKPGAEIKQQMNQIQLKK